MTLAEKVDYYVDRLILQYKEQDRARATVAICVKQALADDLPAQLLTAFDIETAVGAQLDVLGKYVGLSRNVGFHIVRPYFGLWDTNTAIDPALYQGTWDPTTNTPALPDPTTHADEWYVASQSGASTTPIVQTWLAGDLVLSNGINWGRDITQNGNGLTSSTDPAVNANGVFYRASQAAGQISDLTDAEYQAAIKLKIVLNSIDETLSSIMDYLHEFFPGLIFLVDNQDMSLSYSVVSTVPLSVELLTLLLPRPMGVGISITIINPPNPGGSETLTTEDGDVLTTEDGSPLVTETTT